ncbi:unnamed protein product, partial [Polarella glacialis]
LRRVRRGSSILILSAVTEVLRVNGNSLAQEDSSGSCAGLATGVEQLPTWLHVRTRLAVALFGDHPTQVDVALLRSLVPPLSRSSASCRVGRLAVRLALLHAQLQDGLPTAGGKTVISRLRAAWTALLQISFSQVVLSGWPVFELLVRIRRLILIKGSDQSNNSSKNFHNSYPISNNMLHGGTFVSFAIDDYFCDNLLMEDSQWLDSCPVTTENPRLPDWGYTEVPQYTVDMVIAGHETQQAVCSAAVATHYLTAAANLVVRTWASPEYLVDDLRPDPQVDADLYPKGFGAHIFLDKSGNYATNLRAVLSSRWPVLELLAAISASSMVYLPGYAAYIQPFLVHEAEPFSIIECGAHDGSDTVGFAQRFPAAHIWAFEANPSVFPKLKATVDKCGADCQHVKIVNVALGAEDLESTQFFANPPAGDHPDDWGTDSSSSRYQPRYNQSRFVQFAPIPLSIRLERLETIASRVGMPPVRFMELDAEGGELDILKGAGKLLAEVRLLKVEVRFKNEWLSDHPLFDEVNAWLQRQVLKIPRYILQLKMRWVILQNCHLGIDYMCEVEDTLTKMQDIDQDYRLWITCEITSRFPIGLLQIAIKVTLEPPAGLKAQLYRTYTTMITQETLDKVDHERWRTLLFVMAVLHSIVQERRKFGPVGWCVPYEFNNSDLDASLLFLEKHLSSTIMVGTPLSWNTIQYMVAEVQYGGRITDDLDRELFVTYGAKWLCDEIFKPSFAFNNYEADYYYRIPDGLEISVFRDSIDMIPSVDSPLVFGLHTNADLTYRLKEASEMLTTIIETQPKESGSGTGKSVDEIVKEQAIELLDKMPPDFVEEVFRSQIMKLRGPPKLEERGFSAPLNIFLFQELQRLQNIISIVRSNLESLAMAIDGTVVMTTDLLEDLNSVYDGRVPKRWTHDASGAEISWLLPNIGGWFTGLLDRYQQLSTWLEHGRKEMKSYCITSFINAQGFLTGICQEVTRQRKKDQWALDDVVTHTEVLTVDPERVREMQEEGQNIHGLFIEGARWNKQEGKLEESEAKRLHMPMPVMHVSAMTVKDVRALGGTYGNYPPFNAAVYKYPRRNDRYLIFRINLRSGEFHPTHWRLRGACLVAQIE